MATDHRRRTDVNGDTMHERKTDSDYIARVGEFMTRWKILWAIAGAIGAWYGKTILEPLRVTAQTTQQVTLINEKIDRQILPRLDSADADRRRLIENQITQGRILGYLSRMQCLSLDAIDRVKADLDCRDIPIQAAPK